MKTIKVLIDQRQIAGYLRDALFNRSVFLIELSGNIFRASLENIFENSARDRKGGRSLYFEIIADDQQSDIFLKTGSAPEFSVALDRTVLRFCSKIIEHTSSGLIVSLPSECSIIISRKNHRFDVKHLIPRNCTVSILDD